MSDKKTLLLYQDYEIHFKLLSDEDKGKLLMAIFAYNKGEEVELEGEIKIAFSFIKAQMDRDAIKYEERAKRSRENGKRGGRPPKKYENEEEGVKNQTKPKKPSGFSGLSGKPNETQQNQTKPGKPDTDTDTDTDTDISSSSKKAFLIKERLKSEMSFDVKNKKTDDLIDRWISDYSDYEINKAIDKAMIHNARSINYIDTTLINQEKKNKLNNLFIDARGPRDLNYLEE